MDNKCCGCLLLLFFTCCLIPWVVISSFVLGKYNQIEGYDNCKCSFDNLHDEDIQASYGRFSHVSIETNATCEEEKLNVTIEWPPGEKWIDPKSDKELVEYINRITVIHLANCKINRYDLYGVTENISIIGVWIFSLCLSLFVSFSVFTLSCHFLMKNDDS